MRAMQGGHVLRVGAALCQRPLRAARRRGWVWRARAGQRRTARRLLAILFSLMAGSVAAATCTFSTLCIEDAACVPTDLTLEVTEETLTLAEGTFEVNGGGSASLRVAVANSPTALHVIVHGLPGEARYSRHIFAGPRVETYLGTCS
ncbi:MAG: hypothetical protein AAGF78_05050 [Pseudomonadota bacterium]